MRKWILLFIYYGIGIILVILFSIRGANMHYGYLSIQYTLQIDNHLSCLRMTAQSEPRWHWRTPENHRYAAVTFQIGFSETVAKADLIKGMWTKDKETGKLDVPGLARMIDPNKPLTFEYTRQLREILANLDALHKGTFYRPNHHGYSFETPIQMSSQHVTCGTGYTFWGFLTWIVLWPVCMLFSKRRPKCWLPSAIKAFLVASIIIIALDLLLYMVGKAFSPGSISQLMEGLIYVVNSPALILKWYSRMNIEDIFISMFLWGNIVSGIVWCMAKTKESQIVERDK